MPFDADPEVCAWFVEALESEYPAVRRRAVELLERVDCPPRAELLLRAGQDRDPSVTAAAALVEAALKVVAEIDALELLESDLADGIEGEDLGWEWEYAVIGCPFGELPTGTCLVWTGTEDDDAAKRLGALKLFFGQATPERFVVAIVGKSLVTRFTRSPRSFAEAMRWRHEGRPRYRETGAERPDA